ncbi:hypothetical protein D9M71_593960 [compost metagenome]
MLAGVTLMKCRASLAVVMAGNSPALSTTTLKLRKPLATRLSKVSCKPALSSSRSITTKAICGAGFLPRWAKIRSRAALSGLASAIAASTLPEGVLASCAWTPVTGSNSSCSSQIPRSWRSP